MSIDDGNSTETMINRPLFPRESDLASLYIVDQLKQCHNELVSDVGDIENVFTLFFHHIVVHFSGIVVTGVPQNNRFPTFLRQYFIDPARVLCYTL